MMEEYIIELPNEKTRSYLYITMFILLINGIAFGNVFGSAVTEKIKNFSAGGMMMSGASILFILVYFYMKKLSGYRVGIPFLLLSICWLLIGNYLFAILVLCFAVIGFYTSRKFNVIFTKDKIHYPSFPAKTFLWNEVSNVMLKDDVLTIDLKNNKLIQAVIAEGDVDEIDEENFNEFCRKQMKH